MSKIREVHGRKDKRKKSDNWAACRLEQIYMGMIKILERNKMVKGIKKTQAASLLVEALNII